MSLQYNAACHRYGSQKEEGEQKQHKDGVGFSRTPDLHGRMAVLNYTNLKREYYRWAENNEKTIKTYLSRENI